MIKTVLKGVFRPSSPEALAVLKRMGLETPKTLDERMKAYLLLAVL